jgi:GTP-binding protein
MASDNFVDYVKIHTKSGNGGGGSTHFRREKYIPNEFRFRLQHPTDKFKHIGEICSFWCNTSINWDKTTFEICGAYGGFTNIEVYKKNYGSYVRCLKK